MTHNEPMNVLAERAGRARASRRQRSRAARDKHPWTWVAVEGAAEISGFGCPGDGIGGERLRVALREIVVSAGCMHDDLGVYDTTMTAEGCAAVVIHPSPGLAPAHHSRVRSAFCRFLRPLLDMSVLVGSSKPAAVAGRLELRD
jgi:hypothetical protein